MQIRKSRIQTADDGKATEKGRAYIFSIATFNGMPYSVSSPEYLTLTLNKVISSSASEGRHLIIYNCANVRNEKTGYERKMYEIAASMKGIEGVEVKDMSNSAYRIALNKSLAAYELYLMEGYGDIGADMLWYMAVQRRAMDAAAANEAIHIIRDMKNIMATKQKPINSVVITRSNFLRSPNILSHLARSENLDNMYNTAQCSRSLDDAEYVNFESSINDANTHMGELEMHLIRYDFITAWLKMKKELLRAGMLTDRDNVDIEKIDSCEDKRLLRALSDTYYRLEKHINGKASKRFNSLVDEGGLGYEHIVRYASMARVVDEESHMPKSFLEDI